MLERELKRIGLTDKEASVYLMSLQLGPAPVQQISRKAKVVRATTYVVLESLMEKGLVTQYKEGKKTLFAAEPPRQLMRLLEKKEDEINNKKGDLDEILPELQAMMKTGSEHPSVRYFEGREGLHAIRQEIIMYCDSGDTIYNFTPHDAVNAVFPANEDTFHRLRASKRINAKTIFTTRSPKLRDVLFERSSTDLNERRYIPPELFPSTSGMTVFRDRVAIGNFSGRQMGVIIDSEPMADTVRRMFDLAWIGAKHIDVES